VFATGWAIKVHPIAEAALTQLVECLAVNQNVVGSSPASGVKFPYFITFFLKKINTCKNFIMGTYYIIAENAMETIRACSSVRLERSAHNRAVTGSNPVRPINFISS
jgi:hypothetical protein